MAAGDIRIVLDVPAGEKSAGGTAGTVVPRPSAGTVSPAPSAGTVST